MFSIGHTALISLSSHIVFIIITWRVLQAVKLNSIFKKGHTVEARVLLLFLTIVIGSIVSNFFLDFLQWSSDLIYLF